MFNVKMLFVNWLCCAIAGIFVSLVLIALFGAIIPMPIVYAASAAAGWVTSIKVLKMFD